MIRFDSLAHTENPPTGHDYKVEQLVPRSVLDGIATEGFEVLSEEQITFGIRDERKNH